MYIHVLLRFALSVTIMAVGGVLPSILLTYAFTKTRERQILILLVTTGIISIYMIVGTCMLLGMLVFNSMAVIENAGDATAIESAIDSSFFGSYIATMLLTTSVVGTIAGFIAFLGQIVLAIIRNKR